MSNLSQFKSDGISNKGEYSEISIYYIDDVVRFLGTVYVCTINGTVGILPTVIGNWSPLVIPVTPSVAVTGAGTNPATFTLTAPGGVITLNRVS